MVSISSNFIKKFQPVTPFFVYDMRVIRRQFLKLKQSLPGNPKIFYSVKTNPHEKILRFIKNLRLRVEITSGGELLKARKVGFPFSKIIFTGPGKTDQELFDSIRGGIYLIIAESFTEIQRINAIAKMFNKKQDILLRINTKFRISERHSMRSLTGIPSKFGIDEEDLSGVIQYANKFKNIRIRGFHSYPASGVLQYKRLLKYIEHFFSASRQMFSEIPNGEPNIIDIGVGLGVNYSGREKEGLELKKYGCGFGRLIKKYDFMDKKIIMEVGRFLVAESADYITKVLDIKKSRGIKFIIVDGGINHLSRAGVLHEGHLIKVLNQEKKSKTERADIVGRLSYPSDFISKNVSISPCKIGDLIAVRNVGAYGLTAGMVNFSSQPLPVEYFLK